MKQSEFFSSLLPLAQKAGEAFRINPAVILAQAAIESGWGQSDLASEYHNYFGITAYGRSNVWWKGQSIELGTHSLRFRVYDTPGDSVRSTRSPPTSATTQKPSPAKSPTANTSAKSTATTVPPIRRCWSRFAGRSGKSDGQASSSDINRICLYNRIFLRVRDSQPSIFLFFNR